MLLLPTSLPLYTNHLTQKRGEKSVEEKKRGSGHSSWAQDPSDTVPGSLVCPQPYPFPHVPSPSDTCVPSQPHFPKSPSTVTQYQQDLSCAPSHTPYPQVVPSPSDTVPGSLMCPQPYLSPQVPSPSDTFSGSLMSTQAFPTPKWIQAPLTQIQDVSCAPKSPFPQAGKSSNLSFIQLYQEKWW